MLLFGAMLFMMNSMKIVYLEVEDKQSWDVQASAPIGGEDAVIEWLKKVKGNTSY